MKKMTTTQYERFLKILESLGKFIKTDTENVKYMLDETMRFVLPEDGMSVGFAIMREAEASLVYPYTIWGTATAPVNHMSKTESLLEIKLLGPQNQVRPLFNTWLSVFPDGRVVLHSEGLVLDSISENNTLDQKKFKTFCNREILNINAVVFISHLIQIFPANEDVRNFQEEAWNITQQRISSCT